MTEASFAVELARKALEHFVNTGEKLDPHEIPENFRRKHGVFVTIKAYPDDILRGCIGFSDAIYPLYQAIIEAVIAAAEDPRFEPIKEEELPNITLEVSILTPPELLGEKREDYPKKVKIGKDGLIVRKGNASGLLLPQVAVEHDMEPIKFLESACTKAGLPISAWTEPDVEVWKFQADIWAEMKPNGEIAYKEFRKS